jgi:hypothetical protein
MLLEQLAEKAAQPAEYDWESYYDWLFSELAGREVSDFRFWQCEKCLTTNVIYLPAKYGKCRCCELLYMP